MAQNTLAGIDVTEGDEIAFRLESAVDHWDDQDEMTVTVQRITEDGDEKRFYFNNSDGVELGFVRDTSPMTWPQECDGELFVDGTKYGRCYDFHAEDA